MEYSVCVSDKIQAIKCGSNKNYLSFCFCSLDEALNFIEIILNSASEEYVVEIVKIKTFSKGE